MLKAHVNGHGFIKDFLKSRINNSGLEFTNILEDAQVFTMKTQVDYVVASAGIPVVNITFIGEEDLPDRTNAAILINHPDGRYSLDDIKADLEAAVAKGYNHDLAFTVHTVRGLIEKIEELSGDK